MISDGLMMEYYTPNLIDRFRLKFDCKRGEDSNSDAYSVAHKMFRMHISVGKYSLNVVLILSYRNTLFVSSHKDSVRSSARPALFTGNRPWETLKFGQPAEVVLSAKPRKKKAPPNLSLRSLFFVTCSKWSFQMWYFFKLKIGKHSGKYNDLRQFIIWSSR